MRITRTIPSDFYFCSAVCSHGWFMLAPNVWDPKRGRLNTIVTLEDDLAAPVTIGQARTKLVISISADLSRSQTERMRAAVERMLRLDENLAEFHARCRTSGSHGDAAVCKFGRLLRSASFFEDVIKVICTCNTSWRQTVGMIDRLVARWGAPAAGGPLRGFPTPHRLARASIADLRRWARVGYRAESIRRFARAVDSGSFDLDLFERFDGPSYELHKKLRQIHGVGDYAAGHLCMLLGRYDQLAIDTELRRLLRERHPRRRFTPAAIRRYYATWHPYQFLVYWYELWCSYTQRHGTSNSWEPADMARTITAKAL